MSSEGSAFEIHLLIDYELQCFHYEQFSVVGFESMYNDMWGQTTSLICSDKGRASKAPMLDCRTLQNAYYRCAHVAHPCL